MEVDPYYRATQEFPLENDGHASKWLISFITVHRWRKQPACITVGTWGRWCYKYTKPPECVDIIRRTS